MFSRPAELFGDETNQVENNVLQRASVARYAATSVLLFSIHVAEISKNLALCVRVRYKAGGKLNGRFPREQHVFLFSLSLVNWLSWLTLPRFKLK